MKHSITDSLSMHPLLVLRHPPLTIKVARVKLYEIVLRIGVCCTFIGHGVLALGVNERWIPLLTVYGFSESTARHLLPIIGCMDILVALIILLRPIRVVVLWSILWAFAAALTRPLAGEPIWEFIERASNWILPLVLFWKLRKTKE